MIGARLVRLRRSLGMRLLGLFLLLGFTTVLIFSAGMQRALSGGWTELVRPLVSDYVDRLAAEIGNPPDPARAQALVQRLPLSIRIEGPRVQFDSQPDRPAWHRHEPADGNADWLRVRSTADGHRISFGIDGSGWQQRPRSIGWFTLGALLLLTALAYAYVRRLFRPLDDIRAGALRYGRGDFVQPIPLRRDDELGELAAQVNTMASELHGMLDAKRALLLAISHELRSPLTRARLNAELVAEGDSRDALLRDLGEMRDLITALLENERLAAGHAALQRETTDLSELLRGLLADSFGAARLSLQVEPGLPTLQLDRTRVRLLLRNLIDNALRHGGTAATAPLLVLRRAGDGIELTLRDFGPGVAPQHLAHLAEPFYRADTARQRSTGGVGLGLALSRLVAQAHGGSLTLRNAEPGFEAAVSLPL